MSIEEAAVGTREDEKAIREAIDRVYTAWADNDADAFVAPYGREATATLPGTFLANREEIRSNMAKAFAGELKGSRAVHDVQSVRFLEPSIAIVLSRSGIVFTGSDGEASGTGARDTWLLRRDAEEWLVEAFQSSPEALA
jgi:uncharacterized protein (TIGR02246 family)